jgi:hypothetical protein
MTAYGAEGVGTACGEEHRDEEADKASNPSWWY